MKRFLLISVTLILLLVSAGQGLRWQTPLISPVHASSPPPTTHAIFSSLLQRIGVKEEITIQDIFGVRPKNVYAHLYQELFERPEKEAIIALSAAYGLTPADAELVIQGSVTPLVRNRKKLHAG
jgi:hypothetical protein